MLKAGDFGRNEYPKVTDVWVGQVNDPLAGFLEVSRVLVDGWDPTEGLVRGGDVVAVRSKDYQRVFDTPEIGDAPVADTKFTLFQLIADK